MLESCSQHALDLKKEKLSVFLPLTLQVSPLLSPFNPHPPASTKLNLLPLSARCTAGVENKKNTLLAALRPKFNTCQQCIPLSRILWNTFGSVQCWEASEGSCLLTVGALERKRVGLGGIVWISNTYFAQMPSSKWLTQVEIISRVMLHLPTFRRGARVRLHRLQSPFIPKSVILLNPRMHYLEQHAACKICAALYAVYVRHWMWME